MSDITPNRINVCACIDERKPAGQEYRFSVRAAGCELPAAAGNAPLPGACSGPRKIRSHRVHHGFYRLLHRIRGLRVQPQRNARDCTPARQPREGGGDILGCHVHQDRVHACRLCFDVCNCSRMARARRRADIVYRRLPGCRGQRAVSGLVLPGHGRHAHHHYHQHRRKDTRCNGDIRAGEAGK